ncbi:MAG: hypothetical protein FWD75_07095 [Propionibacteriaceae bacterium]|nr:hypothetical protein [Propionibacteriaceae bacterium]
MGLSISNMNPVFNKGNGQMDGMNPTDVLGVSTAMSGTMAEGISTAINTLNAKIPNTMWKGEDATRFEQDWSAALQQIRSILDQHIDQWSQKMTKEANDQITASAQ